MAFKLLYVTIMALVCVGAYAKTYYYQLEKIVTNNTQKNTSGSGIFITFTKDGCYDSDAQGYTNDQSYLKWSYSSKYTVYNGITYWGQGEYKFTRDLTRLNVVVNDKVYVYNRVTAPSNVTKSTYIGMPKPSGGSVNGYNPSSQFNPDAGQSATNSNGMSAEWYQSTYNRYANLAQSIYNSITTKIIDYNGNVTTGYVYQQQDSQVAIQGMIRNLRNVQRDMRDLRQEASRHGYTIAKSSYEDIDVKVY